jgi:hypothetical protein
MPPGLACSRKARREVKFMTSRIHNDTLVSVNIRKHSPLFGLAAVARRGLPR